MKNPQLNETVKYTAGLFPELEKETYTIVQVFPNENDIEVFGESSYRLMKVSRLDFGRISKF